jgi:BirA family biotin operon repressor/biotin-[acetyl-CoA-carboxylase] ligase
MRLGLLAIPAVRSALELELGRSIEYHASLPSTQDRARDLAATGAPPLVVVSDHQTAGKGTQGRSWVAAAGSSLLASWLFRPAPGEAAVFALLAGVGVARALEHLGIADARLKWPNDVEVDRKKVAGVLAHATTDGEGGSLVLGIGVNVNQRVDEFPAELRRTATSLGLRGRPVDRLELFALVTRELDRLADPAEHAAGLAEWRERASLIGREVEVVRAGRPTVRGIAKDIAPDGALLVGGERVLAGEVRVLA